MSHKNFFYLDIETTTKSSSLIELSVDDPRGYDLFMKKCETMSKFDADWSKPYPDLLYIEKAPLIPEFGRIICMSFATYTDDKKHIATIIEEDEEMMMRRIAKVITKAGQTRRTICGFNIKIFDLPWIIKKMYKYEIDIPLCLNFLNVKPWEISTTDIMDVWKGIGKTSSTLEEVTYELDIPSTKKPMRGKDVHEYYWVKKDKKSIVEKCENDVNDVTLISEKLKL